ncbi:hypothetical protein K439DRAFT_1621212 [Ramaria rubella]|nr:hypothetical protein K439DRAFT_1621212 [Ramaria rubella]
MIISKTLSVTVKFTYYMEDTIDPTSTTDSQWVPEYCIGQGRCDNSSVGLPAIVYQARNEILAIPEYYDALLPNPRLTVNQFLAYNDLPSIAGDIVGYKLGLAFPSEPPIQHLSWLMERTIPPKNIIDKLEQALGQKWFDGATSFVYQHYKGREPLPFWVITWWK